VVEILISTCLFCTTVLHISNGDNTFFCLSYSVNDLFKTVAVSHASSTPASELLFSGLSVDDLHDKISNNNETPSWMT